MEINLKFNKYFFGEKMLKSVLGSENVFTKNTDEDVFLDLIITDMQDGSTDLILYGLPTGVIIWRKENIEGSFQDFPINTNNSLKSTKLEIITRVNIMFSGNSSLITKIKNAKNPNPAIINESCSPVDVGDIVTYKYEYFIF